MANWRDGKGGNKKSVSGKPGREPSARPSGGGKTDWRSSKSTGSKRAIKSSKPWTEKQEDATRGKRLAFRLKLASVFVLLAVLVGYFIYWVMTLPNAVHLVIVAPQNVSRGTWYSTNSFADEKTQLFENGRSINGNLKVFAEADEMDALVNPKDTNWEKFLQDKKVIARGPGKNVVVFYFTAPAVVDTNSDGSVEPYFLATGNDPLADRDTWISVRAILEKLCEYDFKPKTDQTQLLVMIDAQRVEPISSLGPMYDRFPEAVGNMLKDLGKDNLYVLLSHSNGQSSWVAPELGGSVFAHFASKGLTGAANDFVEVQHSDDDRISLKELAAYVQAGVFAWVRDNRISLQVPHLFHMGPVSDQSELADFEIAYFDKSRFKNSQESAVEFPKGTISDKQKTLDAQWAQLDQISQQDLLNHPVAAARARAILIRMEQLFIVPESKEFTSLSSECRKILAEFYPVPKETSLVSLGEIAPSISDQRQLKQLFSQWIESQRALVNLMAKSQSGVLSDEDAAKTKKEIEQTVDNIKQHEFTIRQNDRQEIAWMIWNGFVSETESLPTQQELDLALKLLSQSVEPALELVEIHFLKLLRDNVDWHDPTNAGLIRNAVSMAIKTRDKSETLVANCSPGAHFWIENQFDELEQSRRLLEDNLFAGQYADLETKYSDLTNKYEQLQLSLNSIENALVINNQARMEIPYLAAWIMREKLAAQLKGSGRSNEAANYDLLFNRLKGSITKINDLTRKLQDSRDLQQDSRQLRIGSFLADVQDVESALKEVVDVFRRRCDELKNDKASDVANLVGIQRVLLCPLIPGRDRVGLREKFIDSLTKQFGDDAFDVAKQPDKFPDIFGHQAYQSQVMELTSNIPAVSQSDAEAIAKLYSGASWAELVSKSGGNERIAKVSQQCQKLLENSGLKNEALSINDRLRQMQELDSLIRTVAAPLTEQKVRFENQLNEFAKIRPEFNTINRDMKNIWMAKRSLEDFWGDNQYVRSSTGVETEDPYFARLANRYINRVDKYNNRSFANNEFPKVEQLKSDYLDSARNLEINIAKNQLLFQLGDNSTFKEQMKNTLNISTKQIPRGFTCVFAKYATPVGKDPIVPFALADEQSDGSLMRRMRVDFNGEQPPENRSIDYQFSSTDLDKVKGSKLETVFAFRGHGRIAGADVTERKADVVQQLQPQITKFKFDNLAEKAQVLVAGEGRTTTDVVFILDCSQSMNNESDIAGETSSGGGSSSSSRSPKRIDVAKGTLTTVLSDLKDRQDLRIGFIAFGHRVEMDEQKAKEGLLAYKYFKTNANDEKNLYLNNDVEILHPLSEGDYSEQFEYNEIIDQYLSGDRLQPHGLTPLYRAISIAAKHLQSRERNKDVPKQIVVLTDGENVQWGTSAEGAARELRDRFLFTKLYENNQLAPELKGVTVTIVGLDFESDTAVERKNVTTLVEETGGKELYPADVGGLTSALKDSVRLAQFAVVHEQNNDTAFEKLKLFDLGKTWKADDSFQPGKHWVKIRGKTEKDLELYLYGGENIQVDYRKDGSIQVVPRPSERDIDRATMKAAIALKDSSGEYEIGRMLANNKTIDGTQFQFVIRNKSPRQISYRPGHLFLEVIPKADQKPVLPIQDYLYLPGKSVPVVQFDEAIMDSGDYTLRLWYVPRDFDLGAPIRLDPTDRNNFETEAPKPRRKISIQRDGDRVIAKIENGDPETLKKMFVKVENAQAVDRKYQFGLPTAPTGGQTGNPQLVMVEHTFYLRSDHGNAPAKLWIKEFDEVFGPINGVTPKVDFDDYTHRR
jgi:Mg-chelatase subunit ChlD